MTIQLFSPIKTARRLGLPRYVVTRMAMAIAWMWFREKLFCLSKRCMTNFQASQRFGVVFVEGTARLVYYDWGNQERNVYPIKTTFSELKDRLELEGVNAIFQTCSGKVICLSCGCRKIIHWLAFDARPENDSEAWECSDCGKYHAVTPREQDEYVDCPWHVEFFRRWPEAHRGVLKRELDPGGAGDILRSRLIQGTLAPEMQNELCCVIAKNSYESFLHLGVPGLAPELRDLLAFSVKRKWQAKSALEKYHTAKLDLGPQALRHLERVVMFWGCALWLLRLALALAAGAMWLRYVPEWQAVAVVVATLIAAKVLRGSQDWRL